MTGNIFLTPAETGRITGPEGAVVGNWTRTPPPQDWGDGVAPGGCLLPGLGKMMDDFRIVTSFELSETIVTGIAGWNYIDVIHTYENSWLVPPQSLGDFNESSPPTIILNGAEEWSGGSVNIDFSRGRDFIFGYSWFSFGGDISPCEAFLACDYFAGLPGYEENVNQLNQKITQIKAAIPHGEVITMKQWGCNFRIAHINYAPLQPPNVLPLCYAGAMGLIGGMLGGSSSSGGAAVGMASMAFVLALLQAASSASAAAGGRVLKNSEGEESFDLFF